MSTTCINTKTKAQKQVNMHTGRERGSREEGRQGDREKNETGNEGDTRLEYH